MGTTHSKPSKSLFLNRANIDDDHSIFYDNRYLFSSSIVSKSLSVCLKNIITRGGYEIEIHYNDDGIINPIKIKDKTGTVFYLYFTKNNKCKIIKLMYNDIVYKFSCMSGIQSFFETRNLIQAKL